MEQICRSTHIYGYSKVMRGKKMNNKKNWIAVVIPDGCKQVFITDDKEFFNEQLETGGMVSLCSGRINKQDTSPEVYIGYRKEIITQAPNVVSDQGIPAPLVHSIAKQDTLNDC